MHDIFYFIKRDDKTSDLLYFQKTGERNISTENKVIELLNSRKLSDYLLPSKVKTFDFVGRTITLNSACEWRAPNSMDCEGGLLTWSVFDSYDKAEADYENRILQDMLYADNEVVSDESIPIVFEKELVFGRRIVYRSKSKPQYNPFIIYYLATGVRGQYVSCLMGHYGDNENDYYLPSLLSEVMQIDESIQKEPLETENIENYRNKYDRRSFRLKAGIYLPIGHRKDILGNSFFFDIGGNAYLGGNSISISELTFNVGFVIPNNRKTFDYFDGGWVEPTHANLIINGNIGYEHTLKINSLYWGVFTKMGFSTIGTDVYNGTDEDGYDKYKYIGEFSMGLGSQIRFQQVFLFLEYQYAPFQSNTHMLVGGDSALMFGLGVGF